MFFPWFFRKRPGKGPVGLGMAGDLLGRGPMVRQEVVELAGGVVADAGDDVFEVGENIEVMRLADWVIVKMTATVRPPLSLPKKSPFLKSFNMGTDFSWRPLFFSGADPSLISLSTS